MATWSVKLFVDKVGTFDSAGMFEQRPTVLGKRLDACWIIADAVVDIVGILLLITAVQGMSFIASNAGVEQTAIAT